HIVKGGKKRKARGTVQASHIMKMVPQNAGPAAEKAAREAIDSIYRVVKADPSAFASLASTLSDDKGSARNGGQLPWFGAGEMVAPFDSAAFAMSVGEISEPVRTQFGWHIIHKTDQRGVPSLEEIRPRLLERITNPQDDRSRIIKAHQTETLARKHKGAIKNSTLNALKARVGGAGLDSLFYEACSDGSLGRMTLLSIDKKDVPVSEFANYLHGYRQDDPEMALSTLDRALAAFYNKRLVEAEQDWLEANQPEYRNLLNEYRDGSLLYEVSVEKVWDKASKDQEGLEHYFNMHRGDYTWTEPHVKGLLVNAVDREVAEQIRSRLDRVPSDSLTTVVRKEFAGKASAERIMTAKGSNPLVDYLMFGGPEVSAPGNYTVSFIYDARILDAPEEAADVRGMVTSDYQNRLEADWIEELRGRYPIKVNEKVLKKVK
ncbi:MAG: peptidyl-prolyl cis-trans isomerase, partial [Muribaculaceae bacterium]|nr:peptidyl-prolyl cis-trans isomerase [Muribaculaceae bacterium]